jgi:hypothetical protein
MSGIAIGSYIKLLDAGANDTGFNFQNFFQGEDRLYNGDTYTFGGFGFSGGTLDLEGSNISASLVFSVGELSLSIFRQAAEEFWLVRIRTVWLDPDTFVESRLSVRLSSPLDAVQDNAPRRTLNSKLVGELPSTGQISLN